MSDEHSAVFVLCCGAAQLPVCRCLTACHLQCLCHAVVLRNCLSVVALQHVICSVCVVLQCCATACLSLPYSMSSVIFIDADAAEYVV